MRASWPERSANQIPCASTLIPPSATTASMSQVLFMGVPSGGRTRQFAPAGTSLSRFALLLPAHEARHEHHRRHEAEHHHHDAPGHPKGLPIVERDQPVEDGVADAVRLWVLRAEHVSGVLIEIQVRPRKAV